MYKIVEDGSLSFYMGRRLVEDKFQLSLCRTTPGAALACFLLDPKAFYTEERCAPSWPSSPKTKRPKHFLKISENWTEIASFSYLKTDLDRNVLRNSKQSGFEVRIDGK